VLLLCIARSSNRIAEIVEDGNGEEPTYSNLAKAAVQLAEVASANGT
jgi:hypothetical protein